METIEARSLGEWGRVLQRHAEEAGLVCFCGEELREEYVDYVDYGDESDPLVKGLGNVFVYIHCPKCGHDWGYTHILRSTRGRRG